MMRTNGSFKLPLFIIYETCSPSSISDQDEANLDKECFLLQFFFMNPLFQYGASG